MNNLENFLREVYDGFRDRLKSYLFFNFFIAFLIFNWRPLVFMIFSDEPIENRIQIFDTYFKDSILYLYPIIYAVCFTAFSKFILLVFDWVLALAIVLRNKAFQWIRTKKIENKINEEIAKIKLEKEKQNFSKIEQINITIEQLQAERDKLNSEIGALKLKDIQYSQEITKLNTDYSKISDELYKEKSINNILLDNFSNVEFVTRRGDNIIIITKEEISKLKSFLDPKEYQTLRDFLFSPTEVYRRITSATKSNKNLSLLSEIFNFLLNNAFIEADLKGDFPKINLKDKGFLLKDSLFPEIKVRKVE